MFFLPKQVGNSTGDLDFYFPVTNVFFYLNKSEIPLVIRKLFH